MCHAVISFFLSLFSTFRRRLTLPLPFSIVGPPFVGNELSFLEFLCFSPLFFDERIVFFDDIEVKFSFEIVSHKRIDFDSIDV